MVHRSKGGCRSRYTSGITCVRSIVDSCKIHVVRGVTKKADCLRVVPGARYTVLVQVLLARSGLLRSFTP